MIAEDVVTLPLFARPQFLVHQKRLAGTILNPTNTNVTWNTQDWVLKTQ